MSKEKEKDYSMIFAICCFFIGFGGFIIIEILEKLGFL